MQVKFQPYRRRDGALMLYINGSNTCRIGISADRDYQSSKATQGEKKLWYAAFEAIRNHGEEFTGSVDGHTEGIMRSFFLTLLITDIANIGGMKVDMDGGYVVYENQYVPCGVWLESEPELVDA